MLSFYAVPHTVVSSEVGTRGLLVSLLFLHPNTHDPHTQAHRASSPGATSLDPQTQTSRLLRSFWDSPIPTHPPHTQQQVPLCLPALVTLDWAMVRLPPQAVTSSEASGDVC